VISRHVALSLPYAAWAGLPEPSDLQLQEAKQRGAPFTCSPPPRGRTSWFWARGASAIFCFFPSFHDASLGFQRCTRGGWANKRRGEGNEGKWRTWCLGSSLRVTV
jgi:hypothetical protein